MKKVCDMELYSLDECLDEHIGKKGTTERNDFEKEVDAALYAYRIGETIKRMRLTQNITQEELGVRVGVKKTQISQLEKGYCITIPTKSWVFKALGVPTASVDFGSAGRVALW